MVEKCDIPQVVKILYPKKPFDVIFLIALKFSVGTFKMECFNEKRSSLAGLKKSYSISRKSTDFRHFWLHRSIFKDDSLNVQEKFQRIFGQFPGGGCSEHCPNFWVFYLQKVWGALAVLQVDIFQNPWFYLVAILWRGHL